MIRTLPACARRSRLHTLGTAEMLCREGDRAERFFIVLSGRVKLFRVTDQGSERVLGSAGRDEVLAEVPACSPDGRYPWYAQCLEPTRVRSFSGALLRELRDRDLIQVAQRQVTILDRAGLQELMG